MEQGRRASTYTLEPAGHYSCRHGELEAAIFHFKAAKDTAGDRRSTAYLAVAEAVASTLHQGGEGALPQAFELLPQSNSQEARGQHGLIRCAL